VTGEGFWLLSEVRYQTTEAAPGFGEVKLTLPSTKDFVIAAGR
jgi:hypothetical protein